MKYLKKYNEFNISENLKYHFENKISILDNIFRPNSEAYYDIITEARKLYDSNNHSLFSKEDLELYESTDIGLFDYYNGELVPLDYPMLETRVPREEREEVYRDENVIIIKPLTHRALKKYATNCQWCINSDEEEWEDYHKGHLIIIQRNKTKHKKGITNNETATEIFYLGKLNDTSSTGI